MEDYTMKPLRRSQTWLPDVFNDIFSNDWMLRTNATAPAINVIESDDEYKVEIAAAGMTKNDFDVRIDEDNNLVISMEKKDEKKDENANAHYLRREFSYSKFEQTMILPDNADKDGIKAKVEDGVLNVHIPKMKEEEIKKNVKMIEVH